MSKPVQVPAYIVSSIKQTDKSSITDQLHEVFDDPRVALDAARSRSVRELNTEEKKNAAAWLEKPTNRIQIGSSCVSIGVRSKS